MSADSVAVCVVNIVEPLVVHAQSAGRVGILAAAAPIMRSCWGVVVRAAATCLLRRAILWGPGQHSQHATPAAPAHRPQGLQARHHPLLLPGHHVAGGPHLLAPAQGPPGLLVPHARPRVHAAVGGASPAPHPNPGAALRATLGASGLCQARLNSHGTAGLFLAVPGRGRRDTGRGVVQGFNLEGAGIPPLPCPPPSPLSPTLCAATP